MAGEDEEKVVVERDEEEMGSMIESLPSWRMRVADARVSKSADTLSLTSILDCARRVKLRKERADDDDEQLSRALFLHALLTMTDTTTPTVVPASDYTILLASQSPFPSFPLLLIISPSTRLSRFLTPLADNEYHPQTSSTTSFTSTKQSPSSNPVSPLAP